MDPYIDEYENHSLRVKTIESITEFNNLGKNAKHNLNTAHEYNRYLKKIS